ncbi:MAG: spore germination protein GerW family protein [Anaerolineales bacterium]
MADKETDLPDIDRAYTIVEETLSKLIDAADVTKVYGRPIKQGDVTVVPASENLTLMGFGVGAGGETDTSENGGVGAGGGGGGGGRTLSRPVAIIVVTPEGAYVEPVMDPTKVAMAAITAAGFMFGMMLRMVRKR